MIKIVGNDLMRSGTKIGWIEGNDILEHDGKKLGYFSGNKVYDVDGKVLGYIEGNLIKTPGMSGSGIRVDENHIEISGGELSDIGRAAVRLLLGD